MKGFLEIIILLLNIWKLMSFFALISLYMGLLDEARHEYSKWKDVFYVLRYCTVSIVLAQGLIFSIQRFGLGETLLIDATFSWGFRITALASFLRVLWPIKYWWSDTEPNPRYPRLKLSVYALLSLVLSFISSLINIR